MENILLIIEITAKILSPIFTTGEGLMILGVFGLTAFAFNYKHQHNC